MLQTFGEFFKGRIHPRLKMLGHRLQRLIIITVELPRPWGNGAIVKAEGGIRHNPPRINHHPHPQTVTGGASAVGAVETEQTWFNIIQRKARFGA